MGQETYVVRQGGDADLADLTVDTLTIGGAAILATSILLGSGEVADINGEADALVLDADADTTISAPTDDQIDIELNSVDHVVLKGVAGIDAGVTRNIMEIAFTSPADTTGTNTHNGLNIDVEIGNASGGTNAVNAIAIDNITGDAQVTETGLLCGTGFDVGIDMQGTKIDLDADNDTSIVASTDDTIDVEISGATDFTFTANTLTAVSGSTIATNTIAETTATSGVTIDGVLCKDAAVTALTPVIAVTADGAVAVPAGSTTYFITENVDGAAMTLVDPTATTHDGLVLTFISTTAQAHTLDLVTGINGGAADVGTFGGAAGDGVSIVAYQGVWYALPNVNTNVTWA